MQLKEKPIASPLNYTGGKYKLLPQIFPLFPEHVNTFVDLFCGGANVGVNVVANKIICNDYNQKLIGMFKFFQTSDYDELIQKIFQIINDYELSNSAKNGYAFYNCNTANGLGSYNKNKFLSLRDYFNNLNSTNENYYLYLYILIVYAFNNQIRFNAEDKFNLPVGKRDLNIRMQKKLKIFLDNIRNIDFQNNNFINFNINQFNRNDFIYADPPYLITCASYNEKKGWNEENEVQLLNFLDLLTKKGVRFALSNVLTSKGKTNSILRNWILSNPRYKCHHLEYTYKNSNYHKKDKINQADEVLITNY